MPHTHHHLFHYFLNRELSEIYASIAIRSFAFSLINIFIPIYFFEIGFSLSQIALFFITLYSTLFIFVFISAKVNERIGVKKTILLSMPLTIVAYILLQFIQGGNLNYLFFLIAALFGIFQALFWIPFHIDFSAFSKKKLRGEQIGGYQVICSILTMFGPLLGGIILKFLGFHILFIIVSCFLFAAVIPLFLSEEIHIVKKFSFRDIKKEFKLKESLGYFGSGLEGVCTGVIWPIFIFMFLKTYISVGFVSSVTPFIALISTIIVGRFIDKGKSNILIKIGSILLFFGWLIRSFLRTFFAILGINIYYGTAKQMTGMSIITHMYNKTKKINRESIILSREIPLEIGRILFFVIIFFLPSFLLAFILAALGSVGMYIFTLRNKENKK